MDMCVTVLTLHTYICMFLFEKMPTCRKKYSYKACLFIYYRAMKRTVAGRWSNANRFEQNNSAMLCYAYAMR